MRNKLKKLPFLLTVFAILFLVSGNFAESKAASVEPDYSGNWDISFYDATGELVGTRTVSISEDGTISGKTIMNINTVVYLTEISGAVSNKGKITDGTLTDTDRLDMVGSLSGSFTDTEGKGQWKNYYGKGGTWKATRSTKLDKRG